MTADYDNILGLRAQILDNWRASHNRDDEDPYIVLNKKNDGDHIASLISKSSEPRFKIRLQSNPNVEPGQIPPAMALEELLRETMTIVELNMIRYKWQ